MGNSLSSGDIAKDTWTPPQDPPWSPHSATITKKASIQTRTHHRTSIAVQQRVSLGYSTKATQGREVACKHALSVGTHRSHLHRRLHAYFGKLPCYSHEAALCRRLTMQLEAAVAQSDIDVATLFRIGEDILSEFPPELFLFIVSILAGSPDWGDTFHEIMNLARVSKLSLRRITDGFSVLKSRLSITFDERTLRAFVEAAEAETAMDVDERISAAEVRCMVIGQARFAFTDVFVIDKSFVERIGAFLNCMDTVRRKIRTTPPYETAFRFSTAELDDDVTHVDILEMSKKAQNMITSLHLQGQMDRMTRLEFVHFELIDADLMNDWLTLERIVQVTDLILRNSFWQDSFMFFSPGTVLSANRKIEFNNGTATRTIDRESLPIKRQFGVSFGRAIAELFFYMPQLRVLELTSDLLVPEIGKALSRLSLTDKDIENIEEKVSQRNGLSELRQLIVRTPNTWRRDQDQPWTTVVNNLKQLLAPKPLLFRIKRNARRVMRDLVFTQEFVAAKGFVDASTNGGFRKLTHVELEHVNVHVDADFRMLLPLHQLHTLSLRDMLVTDSFFQPRLARKRWALRHLELEAIPFHILKAMRGVAVRTQVLTLEGDLIVTQPFEGILAKHFTRLIDDEYAPQESDYVQKQRTDRDTRIVKMTYLTEETFGVLLPLKEGDGHEHMLQVLRLAFQPLLREQELTAILDAQWRNMETLRVAFSGHTFHTPVRIILESNVGRISDDQQLRDLIDKDTENPLPLGFRWEPFGISLQSVGRLGNVLASFAGTVKDREIAAFNLSTLRKLHLEYINAQRMREPTTQIAPLLAMSAETEMILGELRWAKPKIVRDHLRLSSETATSAAEGNRERMDRLVTNIATLGPNEQHTLAILHLNQLTEQIIEAHLPQNFDVDEVKDTLVHTGGTFSLAVKQFVHPNISRNLVELTLQTVTLTEGVFLPLLIEDVASKPLPLQQLQKLVLGGRVGRNVTVLHYLDFYALLVGTGGLPNVTDFTFLEIATELDYKDVIEDNIFPFKHKVLPKLEHLVVSPREWLDEMEPLEINQGKDLFTITAKLQRIMERKRDAAEAMEMGEKQSVTVFTE